MVVFPISLTVRSTEMIWADSPMGSARFWRWASSYRSADPSQLFNLERMFSFVVY